MVGHFLRSISMRNSIVIILACFVLLSGASCSISKAVKYLNKPIPVNSGVAIIVDTPNKQKNLILARFLARGFTVKAINASDFYSINDVFDIRYFKKVSYIGQNDNFLSLEKTYNNLYKMHFYNFEINKAEMLAEMKNKWNVQYLVILDLKGASGCWGRAIDLRTNDIVWIENYGSSFGAGTEKIIDDFIDSMTGK
jgi:hypothetical protein